VYKLAMCYRIELFKLLIGKIRSFLCTIGRVRFWEFKQFCQVFYQPVISARIATTMDNSAATIIIIASPRSARVLE